MSTYCDLNDHLGSKDERPYGRGHNSRARRLGNSAIAVRYHSTDILTYQPDGCITLNSGGWQTLTTKEHINDDLPAPWRLYQKRSVWYLWNRRTGEEYIFQDGITITAAGEVLGAAAPCDTSKLRQAIDRYIKAYLDDLLAGAVPAPGPGDCLYCQWGLPEGEHLESHLDESYYVPSLLLRAIEEKPVSPAALWVLAEKWNGGEDASFVYDLARQQLGASLRRYLRRGLGLAA
jgi:hypothetical protein